MAGVAGLEPVTSAVTGQRSNQLSYTPAKGDETLKKVSHRVKFCFGKFLDRLQSEFPLKNTGINLVFRSLYRIDDIRTVISSKIDSLPKVPQLFQR